MLPILKAPCGGSCRANARLKENANVTLGKHCDTSALSFRHFLAKMPPPSAGRHKQWDSIHNKKRNGKATCS